VLDHPCDYRSFLDSQGEAGLLVAGGKHVGLQIANDRPQDPMGLLEIEEDCSKL
jgi:hypothetical protein